MALSPSNLSVNGPSALWGQPAATQDDWYIVRGFTRILGVPDGKLNPSHGLPIASSLHPPPNYPMHPSPNIVTRNLVSKAVPLALVILITGARLALRILRKDLRVSWDDYMIIPACGGVVAWYAMAIASALYGGAGKHLWDVTYHEVSFWFRMSAISQTTFWVTVGLIKISINLFNRRLTGFTSRRWMIAHNTFLVFIIAYMISALATNILQCRYPYGVQYSIIDVGRAPVTPTCIKSNTVGITFSILHIVTDFMLLSVPAVVLYRISMPWMTKLRLGFLFSIGTLACIGSVMRCVVLFRLEPDITYATVDHSIWTVIDLFFAITAASLPILNAAVPKRWPGSENNNMPALRNLTLLNPSRQRSTSMRLHSLEQEVRQRPDGTVMDVGELSASRTLDVEKDSFKRKTMQSWEDAFESEGTSVSQVPVFLEKGMEGTSSRGRSATRGSMGSGSEST